MASSPADAAAKPRFPHGTIGAVVKKVSDGDTVDVRYHGRTLRVELLDVNAPERGRCQYSQAVARLKALLPAGKTVRLLRDKKLKDGRGHYLYYAFNAKGTFVNRNLVRYGYARAVLTKPNTRYIAKLRADQAKAKREHLRIWSRTCGGSASSTPKPDARDSSTGGGTDTRYRTCAEANAHGLGPYQRGVDPEYTWYQDRDGDGLVCEG